MFARSLIGGLLLVALGAAPALALDIQGKWGLGVAAGFASAPDFSIIRGRSQSSAWLLNLNFSGHNETGTYSGPQPGRSAPQNQNALALGVGAGIRKYAQPNSVFSPYLDVSVGASYNRAHFYQSMPTDFARSDYNSWGGGLGLSLGGEYFTPWHFSLAAHTSVAYFQWYWTQRSQEYSLVRYETVTNGPNAGLGLTPSLVLRAYF